MLFGNGFLDLSQHVGGLTVGSIEGDGEVFLGGKPLSMGSNPLATSTLVISSFTAVSFPPTSITALSRISSPPGERFLHHDRSGIYFDPESTTCTPPLS